MGALGTRAPSPSRPRSISFIFMQFFAIFLPNYMFSPPSHRLVPPLPGNPESATARFIRTDCMHRIRWSREGLTSVHNEYTGYLLKHLLLRHMYNLPLPVLMCYAQALCSETSYCYSYCCSSDSWLSNDSPSVSVCVALYCAVLYILLV